MPALTHTLGPRPRPPSRSDPSTRTPPSRLSPLSSSSRLSSPNPRRLSSTRLWVSGYSSCVPYDTSHAHGSFLTCVLISLEPSYVHLGPRIGATTEPMTCAVEAVLRRRVTFTEVDGDMNDGVRTMYGHVHYCILSKLMTLDIALPGYHFGIVSPASCRQSWTLGGCDCASHAVS